MVLILSRYGVVFFLIALVVAVTLADSTFLEWQNFLNIGLQWAPVGLMAIAMTFVVVSGGFDLSVGGTYAASAVLYATLIANHGWGLGPALVACIVLGMVVGLANGLILTKLRVNPFVTTLGTGFIVRGLALAATNGTPTVIIDTHFQQLGIGKVAGIPIPVAIMVGAFVVGAFVLHRTIYGKSLFAVGGSQEAATLSGLRTDGLLTSSYILSGIAAAVAGAIIAARLGSGEADVGVGIELQVITVVLAGGIALSGGEGALWRTAVGLCILAVIGNGFERLQISTFWQSVVTGAILITALAVDAYANRRVGRATSTFGEEDDAAAGVAPADAAPTPAHVPEPTQETEGGRTK